jgi:hypothetical protein
VKGGCLKPRNSWKDKIAKRTWSWASHERTNGTPYLPSGGGLLALPSLGPNTKIDIKVQNQPNDHTEVRGSERPNLVLFNVTREISSAESLSCLPQPNKVKLEIEPNAGKPEIGQERRDRLVIAGSLTKTKSGPLEPTFVQPGLRYEVENRSAPELSRTSPKNSLEILTTTERPRSHGSIKLFRMKRFLESEANIPQAEDRHTEVEYVSDYPSDQLGSRPKRRGKLPKIGSAKLVVPTASDLTPAPGADEYWTWDDSAKAYYHRDSDSQSIFWYDSDSDFNA